MSERDPRRKTVRPALVRLLVLVAAVGGFVAMASVFNPEQTKATVQGVQREIARLRNAKPELPPGAAKPPSRDSKGRILLGEMLGREHRVWVYGQGTEVRYTVCTPEGEVLMTDLAADEVYRLFPEIDLTAMQLDTLPDSDTGAVMIADPAAEGR